jgi:hypothetical protein
MALKVVGGFALILVLALIGTAGVAYYNDPNVFDHHSTCGSCPSVNKSACNQVSPCCSDHECPTSCNTTASEPEANEDKAPAAK